MCAIMQYCFLNSSLLCSYTSVQNLIFSRATNQPGKKKKKKRSLVFLCSQIPFPQCITGGGGSKTLSCRCEGRAAYKGRTLSLGRSWSELRAMSRIMRTADSISSWPVRKISTSPLHANPASKVSRKHEDGDICVCIDAYSSPCTAL